MKFYILTGLVIIFSANCLYAENYYVSGSGSDSGPGTFNNPWKTIGKAASAIEAGDTVFIREGTYYESVSFHHSGSPGNNIVLTAYPGETVTMNGDSSATALLYIPEDYIEIHNIHFINGKDWGIYLFECRFVKIQSCEIKNNLRSGIRVITSSHIDLSDNEMDEIAEEEDWGGGIWVTASDTITISGNSISNTSFGMLTDYSTHTVIDYNYTYNSLHPGISIIESTDNIISNNEVVLACNGGFGECISITRSSNSEVFNNEVHTSGNVTYGGEGICAGGGSSTARIYNNYVHHIDKVSIYSDAGDLLTSDIEIFNNRVDSCNNGIAIGSEKGGVMNNVRIHHNVVTNSGIGVNVSSWVDNGPRENIIIYNNTLYHNIGGIVIETSNIQDVSVLNNLCSSNDVFQLNISDNIIESVVEQVDISYNLIDGIQIHDTAVYGDHYIMASPEFISPLVLNLHLSENSPAIDAGSPDPVYNDPDGTRSDIGAFFYNQGVSMTNLWKTDFAGDLFVYPNPFTQYTTLKYTLSKPAMVILEIIDCSGKVIKVLNMSYREVGKHEAIWHPEENAKGIYICRLRLYDPKSGSYEQSMKSNKVVYK